MQKHNNCNFTFMFGITLGCLEFFLSGITRGNPIILRIVLSCGSYKIQTSTVP